MNTLEAALNYLNLGFSVIPCRANDKKPLVKWEKYQKEKPFEEDLQEWWGLRWPDANIALVTGAISDLTVIDLDGAQGLSSLAALGLHDKIAHTRVIKTPRGYHLYFNYSESFHTGAAFSPGIDVRNDGGYVVAPPSKIDGRSYVTQRDNDRIPLTFPLDALIKRAPDHSVKVETDERPQWVSQALEGGASERVRNTMATRLVGYFHNKQLPKDIIEQVMGDFAKRCTPPMDPVELKITIDSVTRYQTRAQELRITDPPLFTRVGDDLTYSWDAQGITISLGGISQARNSVSCELSVEADIPGSPKIVYGPNKLDLMSSNSKETVVRALKNRVDTVEWSTLVDTVSRLGVTEYRQGAPVVDLQEYTVRRGQKWAIPGFLPDGMPTVLYADGGTGKSVFALALMISLQLQTSEILSLHPTRKYRGLYCDWEFTEEAHGERLGQILEGAKLGLATESMLYIRCDKPMNEMVPQIRDIIQQNGIDFLVIDSAGMASGNKPSDEEMTGLVFTGMRSLGHITSLIINHVNKEGKQYGSVYWQNNARSSWRMVSVQDEKEGGVVHLGLHNVKNNIGGLCNSLGYKVTFSDSSITFLREDPFSQAGTTTGAPIKAQMVALLGREGPMHQDDIATKCDISPMSVRAIANRYNQLFERVNAGENEGLWALREVGEWS